MITYNPLTLLVAMHSFLNNLKYELQEAVNRSEKLLRLHQEYQRDLKAFEVWLAQEQEKLTRYSLLEGDADTRETTLRALQVTSALSYKERLFILSMELMV